MGVDSYTGSTYTRVNTVCFNPSLLFGHYVEIKKFNNVQQASCQFSRRLQNVITMHARKVLYTPCAGKHGAWYKTNFITLKAVLTFQTLMLAMLGKWAATQNCSWTLLPGSTWLQTLMTRLYQSSVGSYRTHFASLKCVDDLQVYRGFMMPLNHQAGYRVL